MLQHKDQTGRRAQYPPALHSGAFPILEVMTNARIERFWSRVVRSDADACWLWTGRNRTTFGYGLMQGSIEYRKYGLMSHRISFALATGREPVGSVLHRCDEPLCCNPAHLYEGTAADNAADMRSRGRYRRGVGVMYSAADRARAIKLRRRGWKIAAIAADVGCYWQTVSRWLSDAGITLRGKDASRGHLPAAPLPRQDQMPLSRRSQHRAAAMASSRLVQTERVAAGAPSVAPGVGLARALGASLAGEGGEHG